MKNNNTLRVKYNQLDNYCKKLAGLSDNESGISLLEKILNYEKFSMLKTVRKFKNDFISHPGTFYTPEAPYEYIKFIESLIDYVHDNESSVREKFYRLKGRKNTNYHNQNTKQNNNYRVRDQQKHYNNFRNYPDPPNGFPDKKFFTYSSKGLWQDRDVDLNYFSKMCDDICDEIIDYEHFDNTYRVSFERTNFCSFHNNLGGFWAKRSPIPFGTVFYLLKKKVSYNKNALCLFNTQGTLYGSVILVIQDTEKDSLTTYGLYYFINKLDNPKNNLIHKAIKGYNVYLTKEDLCDY